MGFHLLRMVSITIRRRKSWLFPSCGVNIVQIWRRSSCRLLLRAHEGREVVEVVRGLLYPNFRLPRRLMQARFWLRVRFLLVLQAQIQGQPLRQSIRRIRPLDDISYDLPNSLFPGFFIVLLFFTSTSFMYQTGIRSFLVLLTSMINFTMFNSIVQYRVTWSIEHSVALDAVHL